MKRGLPHPVFAEKLKLDERETARAVIELIKERLLALKKEAREKTREYAPNIFWIPFYKWIGKEFPAKVGRHMRDATRFLTVLQTCAAINVHFRPTVEILKEFANQSHHFTVQGFKATIPLAMESFSSSNLFKKSIPNSSRRNIRAVLIFSHSIWERLLTEHRSSASASQLSKPLTCLFSCISQLISI